MDGFKNTTKIQYFREGGSVKEMCYGGKMKAGGKAMSEKEDLAQDKAVVKKAIAMHDKQEHKGEKTDLSKLRKGGRAKKDCGTVKKYKAGGNVTNVYEAKKKAGDKDNIEKVKDIKPVMLCGGKSVGKYKDGKMVKQAGATEAQDAFYQANMDKADKKAADKDYEVFGSHGDAARKGMEEGRMDALGNPYKKGGKATKKC